MPMSNSRNPEPRTRTTALSSPLVELGLAELHAQALAVVRTGKPGIDQYHAVVGIGGQDGVHLGLAVEGVDTVHLQLVLQRSV
jgi:hypothetical protein